ncbi:MAG: hypothetical protein ACHRHE_09685 [Tepidisphaerales bacterium]
MASRRLCHAPARKRDQRSQFHAAAVVRTHGPAEFVITPVGFGLVFFLLCAWAATTPAQQTRPTTRPALNPKLETAIIRCLAELDSPEFDVRDKATSRLLEIGPVVLEPLRIVMAGEVSPEFKTRAGFIERELPLRWRHISPEGGEVESGFQAILKTDGDEAAGVLSLELRNAGGVERRLTDVRGLDVELTNAGKKAQSPWGDGRLVLRRIDGDPGAIELRPVVFEKGAPRKVDFKLGAGITYQVKLANVGPLPPGEYEVKVVYCAESKGLIAGAFADVVSNTLRVTIGK